MPTAEAQRNRVNAILDMLRGSHQDSPDWELWNVDVLVVN